MVNQRRFLDTAIKEIVFPVANRKSEKIAFFTSVMSEIMTVSDML